MSSTSILWFRQDLRRHDQPALIAAVAAGAVVPVYVLDGASTGDRAMGGASRWWLHHRLTALDASLRALGSRLILRRGDTLNQLAAIGGMLRIPVKCHHIRKLLRVSGFLSNTVLPDLGRRLEFEVNGRHRCDHQVSFVLRHF